MTGQSIDFLVPIEPRGWARARRRGKRYFVDDQTELFERAIGNVAMVAMRGKKLFSGPLSLTVASYLPVPMSWPAKKREAALANTIAPTSKPDVDNLMKGVADALNGIVYVDDAQIVSGHSTKQFADVPSVRVVVYELSAGSGGTDGSFLKGSTEAG